MNRRQQRVIGLILIGILAAGALLGGGWWLGQRSDRQPAAAGGTVDHPIARHPGHPGYVDRPGSTDQPGSGRELAGASRRSDPGRLRHVRGRVDRQ